MKRQKLYIVIASIVLASVCTGCKKVDNEPVSSYSMTVDAVKTKTLSDNGSAISSTWTAGDEVTVWSSDGTTTQYGTLTAAGSGSSTTLSGTLSSLPADGETLLLKYLSPDYANQDGTLTGSAASIDKLCDYATATVTAMVSGNSVTTTDAAFESQQAILKLTIKNSSGSDITSTITKLTIIDIDGAKSYQVTPSSLSTIYVALPAISNGRLAFIANDGTANYRKAVTGKTLNAGNLTPVTLTTLYAGALTGVFTADGQTVYFSEGNLQATTADLGANWTWAFASAQYACVGNNAANTTISGSMTLSENGTVDLFGWNAAGSTYDNYGINNSITPADYDETSGVSLKNDWGHNPIANGGGTADAWRTMSHADWVYILTNRSASTVCGTANAHYAIAKVNDVSGIILFPDNYTHPSGVSELNNINTAIAIASCGNSFDLEQWTFMEAAGAVFLPCAGYRIGTEVLRVNEYIRYWTNASNKTQARSVYYNNKDQVTHNGAFNRHYGAAVRLVQNAN